MTAFSAVHLALAGFCAMLLALHVAMGLALREERAHRWVPVCFADPFTRIVDNTEESAITPPPPGRAHTRGPVATPRL